MKEMCRHQNITDLPNNFPEKINQAPFTIFNTSNTKTLPKVTIFDTCNLQPIELIHVDFDLYNVTSIQAFISILNVLCAKTIIFLVFPTESQRSPI